MKTKTPIDLLTAKAAAEYLGVSFQTLFRRVETGDVTPYPIEGSPAPLIFDRAHLDAARAAVALRPAGRKRST